MSIKTTIYQALATDVTLGNVLARHKAAPSKPAVYEGWAAEDTRKPYICLTYSEVESDHWAKRDSAVLVDIFSENSSTEAEWIRNRIIKILDRQVLHDTDDRYVRCYLDADQIIDDENPDICHWNVEFSALYWRESFYLDEE